MSDPINSFLMIHEHESSKEYNKAIDTLIHYALDADEVNKDLKSAIQLVISGREAFEEFVNQNYIQK
jgi:hypothetical protein